jgi:hypothetical protein
VLRALADLWSALGMTTLGGDGACDRDAARGGEPRARRGRRGAARAGAAERAAPHRFICGRARAHGRAREGHAQDELGGGGAARKRARRILVLGVDLA